MITFCHSIHIDCSMGNYSWEPVSLSQNHKATNKILYPTVCSGNAKKVVLLADSYWLKLCNVCFICISSPSCIVPFPRHPRIDGSGFQLFALPSVVTEDSVLTPLTSAQLGLSSAEPQRESEGAPSYCCLQWPEWGWTFLAPAALDIER